MQKNVLEYLEKILLKYKNKTAIIDNNNELTFKELEIHSKRLSFIITNKVSLIKRPICVFLPKSANSLIAFLGILYSGNIYVPMDVNTPKARIESIINDLQNPMIITSNGYFDTLVSIGIDSKDIIHINEVYNENIKYDNAMIMERLRLLVDLDPNYIIYTSGSTGKPKGVVVSHRGVIDYIDWAIDCFKINHKEIIGNQSPFYFDNSTLDIYLTLATGATLVIIPQKYFSFPVKLLDYIISMNVNFIFWVPSLMIYISNLKALDSVTVKSLKKILFAGEVMPNKHLNYWRNKLKDCLFANLYGPTEITVDCTYYIVNREFNDNEQLPIGFPCRNTNILILNEDNELTVKDEIGELCIRGSSLALGYWKDFDKSNKVFIQNPLNNNYFDRIYRTGDLVYINEDNEIIFVGRKDSQIKHMGYRIELGEIENAVLSLNGVYNGCVLYDKKRKEITLFYEGSNEIDTRIIRKKLLELLPKYMIPTKIIKLDKLPLNNNNKINRKKLI